MIIFKLRADLEAHLSAERAKGNAIGFIPTMGALHQGHISLISRAIEEQSLPVCSIFVNPAQFNDPSDFQQYPSTITEDIALLEAAGCAVLFLPSVAEIYPGGAAAARAYQFGRLEEVFEGAMRPGHFTGVGKVMAILLEMVRPDALFMGSKDYQQCLIVRELSRQLGMDAQLRFVICPTRREPDGLAMSSRNRRLTEPQRIRAAMLYQCLVSIQNKLQLGTAFATIQKECTELLTDKGFSTEYVAIADANTLEELTQYDPARKTITLIAARIGDIRLIDNMPVN